MKTTQEQVTEFKVIKAVEARIEQIYPGYRMRYGDRQNNDPITIEVSPPVPYMGRFGAGKENWTIDIKEHETYSRMKQVRIKVVGENFTFDENKLRMHVADLRQIVAHAKAAELEKKEADDMLPANLPFVTEPIIGSKPQKYRVDFHANMTLDQVMAFADVIKVHFPKV